MIIIRLSRQFSKIAKELRNNPEFDKIHPEFLQHKPPTTIHRQPQEIQFFKSLLRYKDINKQGYEEALHQNFKTFVEGHNSPRGALKYLSEEDKKAIQVQITQKLQELEDTGLSREEILTNGAHKGIPLCYDSFFQLIKNNEAARLVYLSPGEEFTVQKVVDIALRQDLRNDQFNVPINKYRNNMQLPNHDKQNPLFVNTKDHMEHVNELVQDDVIYHHYPKRQKPIRRVNDYDIHWRNTEFLIQFLNKSSKIKSRHFTNLSETQQKKVARTIKTARHMLLLPNNATIQPFHKKSLTSLQDDIEQFARRKINLENGQIYFETPLQKRERSVENQAMLSLQGEHEVKAGVERPNNLQIIKANVYAEKLKEQELVKQGVQKPKKDLDITYRYNQNEMKFEQIRSEQILKREIQAEIDEKQGEFVEEFQAIKNKIEQIPTHLLSQAIISEQTLQTEKIDELIIKPKKVYSVQESRSIIDEVKARLQK